MGTTCVVCIEVRSQGPWVLSPGHEAMQTLVPPTTNISISENVVCELWCSWQLICYPVIWNSSLTPGDMTLMGASRHLIHVFFCRGVESHEHQVFVFLCVCVCVPVCKCVSVGTYVYVYMWKPEGTSGAFHLGF